MTSGHIMPETQTLFVTPRHTVMVGGKSKGPGSLVTIECGEASFLTDRGFLQSTPPILFATEPNPSGVGIQGGNVQEAPSHHV
jgi:hypothetical protein